MDENSELPGSFDFNRNEYLAMVIPFWRRVKQLAGPEFNVLFPEWYRGPQGVALYIRGYENFSLDLYLNPALAHRVLRYVTEAAKAYALLALPIPGPGDRARATCSTTTWPS